MSQSTRRRMMSKVFLSTAVAASLAMGGTSAFAQQQGQPAPAGQRPAGQGGQGQGAQGGAPGQAGQRPAGQGGGGGFGGAQTPMIGAADTLGFVRIFTPGSLAGWDGDPKFWSVHGDTISAKSTPGNQPTVNTFLIYQGDKNLRDFELKVDYRFTSINGNSGVQVRSAVRPTAPHQWRVSGLQVDFDPTLQYAGQLYAEESGGFVARRGVVNRTVPGVAQPVQVATLGVDQELKGYVNIGGWNTLHIIAKGNTVTSILNGHVMAILIDDNLQAGVNDPAQARLQQGLIALQMHVGAPFEVQFRNVFLKKL